jgi:conjugative transfer region lipoprotein (TIGR03751 family)
MAKPTVAPRLDARLVSNSTDRSRRVPWLWPLCLSLAGCASGSKLSTLPSEGPTMAEIYRQHMTGQRNGPPDGAALPPPHDDGRSQMGIHQQAVANEVDGRFARLPNPDLVMFVTPHLSPNGRYPVPGYSTVFPMYETVEYAMPGEVPVRRAAAAESAAPAPAPTAPFSTTR